MPRVGAGALNVRSHSGPFLLSGCRWSPSAAAQLSAAPADWDISAAGWHRRSAPHFADELPGPVLAVVIKVAKKREHPLPPFGQPPAYVCRYQDVDDDRVLCEGITKHAFL